MGIHQAMFFIRQAAVLPGGTGFWFVSITASPPPATVFAFINWASNGVIAYNVGTSGPTEWFSPLTPDIGNSHWIRVTITSTNGVGAFVGPTGWQSLSTAKEWQIQLTSSTEQTAERTVTFEIATDSSGTNIVSTFTNVTFFAAIVN